MHGSGEFVLIGASVSKSVNHFHVFLKHARIFGDFRVGKIDILIGTQMIAKGLHFPNVTLRGASEERVSYCATILSQRLAKAVSPAVVVSGAAPAPLARIKGLYRRQVMLRCRSVKAMTGPLWAVLDGFRWPADVAIEGRDYCAGYRRSVPYGVHREHAWETPGSPPPLGKPIAP